jgi:hypothetical protein
VTGVYNTQNRQVEVNTKHCDRGIKHTKETSQGLVLTVSPVYFVYVRPLSQCLALTVPLGYFVCFIPLSQCLVLTSTCLFCNTKHCDRGIKHTKETSGSQY